MLSTLWDTVRGYGKTPQVKAPVEPRVQEQVVHPIYYHPILMRLSMFDKLEESVEQFRDYGWRWGVRSRIIDVLDYSFGACVRPGRVTVVRAVNFDLGEGVYCRVQNALEDPNETYTGKRLAYMFLPGGIDTFNRGHVVNAVSGGPTPLALDLVQRVALALNLKIRTLTVTEDQGLLIMFEQIHPQLSFPEYLETIKAAV